MELDDRLLDAIWDRDLARVHQLAAKGVPLVGAFSANNSPFEVAVATGAVAIAIAIIDAGLDLGVWPTKTSPLLAAAHANQPEVVRHLLARGADPRVFLAPEDIAAPFDAALRPEVDDRDDPRLEVDQPATIAALIEGGVPLDEVPYWGEGSILDLARAQPSCGAKLVALLEAAMDAELEAARASDDRGRRESALRIAALRGRDDLVTELLAAGVAVDAHDRCGATALAFAVCGENHAVIRRLLAAGASTRAPDDLPDFMSAITPLCRALRRGDARAVRLLLDAGADVDGNTEAWMGSESQMRTLFDRVQAERAAEATLAPAVLAEITRLGGVHTPLAPAAPRVHAGRTVPEPIRSFLDDITWPDARYGGDPPPFFVGYLQFAALHLSDRPEIGIGVLDGGNGWLLVRLDSPNPADPLVFRRDAEDGGDSGALPLSKLLASLAPDERYVPGRGR